MNFRNRSAGEDGGFELNLTPLMDVMFLLVIFFAVSTSFRVYPGISIDLPAAQSEQIREEEESVTVLLSEAGDIYVDGKKLSAGHLERLLRERVRSAPNLMFVLQADEKARHGQVVELMDTAKRTGISHLAIATRQKGSPSAAGGEGASPAEDGSASEP